MFDREKVAHILEDNIDDIFEKLWGEKSDEYGEKYSHVYEYEICGLCNDLCDFVYQYVKHDFTITTESMVAWVLTYFAACLGKVDKNGCLEVAYDFKKKINEIIKEQ